MDLSLFKESISQHSANLKGDAEMSAFNKAIIRANYYSESTMVNIENTINVFKENVKHSSDITLISEGVKDIGKAIWGAIVKFGKAILDLITRFKIFITGGEKGFIKKLEGIKSRISSSEGTGIDITVPVLKGENGLAGFPKLMEVISLCACGDVYLASNVSSSGVVTWKYDANKAEREELFKSLTDIYTVSRTHAKYGGLTHLFKKPLGDVGTGDAFIHVLAEPLRMCDALVSDEFIDDTDDYNISHIDARLRDIVKGVSGRGINTQILKEMGSKNGHISGIVDKTELKGINKLDVVKALDTVIRTIKGVFEDKKGPGFMFKYALKTMVSSSAAMVKSLNGSFKSKPERLAEIHSIGKNTSVLLNTVLKEFASMANSVKVILYDIVKMLSKQSKKVKPVKLNAYMTDTHTLIAAAMGGDGYVKTE